MSTFEKITESTSLYTDLEDKSVGQILKDINAEDQKIALAVEKSLPQIQALCEALVLKMLAGGRLFYLGAGTSGRLGILDASECPPTYGVPEGLVVGLIAGGNNAIQHAVENAEDDALQGWKDLQAYDISSKDFVVGVAASGTTPYVIGALEQCNAKGIQTGSICCNPDAPLSEAAKFPIEVVVGPEYVTGSTRMKSGTAQKMVLNMISTTAMIQLGRVKGNKMINMQLSNEKLIDRGTKMIMQQLHILDYEQARELLLRNGSVQKVFDKSHLA